ncbi:MAG TPA: TolC family protein [Bacteroidales bacterium]|nr:TolC family protein [Bacteroidales bacterium]
MIKRILIAVTLLAGLLQPGRGQQLLTVQDAIGLAMKNNYDILISRTGADIDKANNTPGNAGMLPSIGVNAADAFTYSHLHQEMPDGSTLTKGNASTNTLTADVGLDWTLFDGGKMFITKKKLEEIQSLGEIQFKDQVMQTLYNVILSYYDVVRQKQQLASINEVIKYNEERVIILQASFNAGLVAKTDLLQAQVDLNVYRENAIVQETVIIATKRTLNQLLSRDPDSPFEVIDSIDLNYIPNREELNHKLYSNNTQVLSQQKQVDIARLTVKEFVAQQLPNLSFSANYSYLLGHSNYGSVLNNQLLGPQVGGALTIPIFYQGSLRRQIKTSRLGLQSAGYGLENIKLQVNMQLQNALTDYTNEMDLVKLETGNLALARENLDISMDRLQLGQTTSLEVRQAEDSYAQSLLRLILFKYSAKVSETRLKQLISSL